MSINMKNVFTSGFVAGIVINISAIGMVPIIGNEMNTVLENRALPPLSSGAMAYFAIMSLILGMFLVWFYAAICPRFGPGTKTAVIVSLVVWFLTYFWSNASMVAFGFMPFRLTVIGTAWGLVELLVASAIATRLYKE
jgi:hypothetical protein